MKSTKERDKRVGKKPQRKTNGDDLRRALNWILIDDIFAHMRLHGNVKWKPLALVCLAIFWLGSSPGNTCPMGWDFLNCLFPPCWGGLSPQTPFHGGNRHGLSGYFVYLGHAM